MKIRHVASVMALAALLSASAIGQQLYKCGATFQDRPCDTDVQKKYSSVTGSFTKEQVTANADPQCAAWGTRAVPIIAARSNYETLEALQAKVDDQPIGRQEKIKEKELIAAVFAKKGSAAEVRGAIETECMEKKQASNSRAQTAPTRIYLQNDNAARAAANAARAAANAARRANQ